MFRAYLSLSFYIAVFLHHVEDDDGYVELMKRLLWSCRLNTLCDDVAEQILNLEIRHIEFNLWKEP